MCLTLYEEIMKNLRPIQHLNDNVKPYSDLSTLVDQFRAGRGKDLPKWPEWCFLPMAAWYAIVSSKHEMDALPINLLPEVSRLSAIGTWRYSQGIYQIDSTLLKELIESPMSGSIPSEVLYRLPEWSMYIETPDMSWMDTALYGFWVHLEWDVNSERSELRFLLDTEKDLVAIPLHIGAWTITEAVDRAMSVSKTHAYDAGITIPNATDTVEGIATQVNPLISILLYLCSQEPEVDDLKIPESSPQRPTPKKTKKGWRLFPADKPRIWSVGCLLGKKLRQLNEPGEPTGRTVKTHLRRGHWHGYWKGSQQGEGDRKFFYKWIPPLVVGQK